MVLRIKIHQVNNMITVLIAQLINSKQQQTKYTKYYKPHSWSCIFLRSIRDKNISNHQFAFGVLMIFLNFYSKDFLKQSLRIKFSNHWIWSSRNHHAVSAFTSSCRNRSSSFLFDRKSRSIFDFLFVAHLLNNFITLTL
jgi:hypothetical protein